MTREEAITTIREKTPQLIADYRVLGFLLRNKWNMEADNAKADSDKPEMAADEIAELYDSVAEFMESYDLDSIEELVSYAKTFRLPKEEEERFTDLESAVRESDWEGIKRCCESRAADS